MNNALARIEPPGFETFVQIVDGRDLKWFLKRSWIVLLLCSVLGAAAGYVYTYFFPVSYRSEAVVRFMPPQLAGRFVNPNFSMEVEQRLFALSQLLSSRLTATRMIDAFHLYPERRRFMTVADLVPLFTSDLAVRQLAVEGANKGVPTLKISFRYPNAEQAQKVVQKLVEQVYEENRKYRGDQSMGTTEFLTEQLRAAEETMLDAEARYGEIQDTLRPSASQTLMGESTSRSYVVDSRLRDLRHDRRLLEERRSLKQAEVTRLESDARSIEARPVEYYYPQVESLVNFWNLLQAASQAKAHAARMRDRWTPGFPDRELAELDVREAVTALDQFRNEQSRLLRAQEREAIVSKLVLARTELRALELQDASGQKEELELRAEAQRLKDRNTAPAGMEADLLTAKREYDTAKEQHTALVRKQSESQAASDMERRGQGESVELLEPATLPLESEKPARWVRILGTALAGLLTGLFLCLANALRNPKILHNGHIEKWAGLEILAQFQVAGNTPAARLLPPSSKPPRQTWRRRSAVTATLVLALLSSACADRFLTANTLWQRGQQAEKDGRSAAAMLFYRQAIRKDSRFAAAYRSAGLLALQLGELLHARDFLTRAIEFDSNDAEIHAKLADTTYQLYFGDPGRPTTILREVEALAQKIESRWPRLADGYRIHSQVLMERHRTEEAVALLDSAVGKVDHRETLDTQAAAALFRLGRAAESEARLREVIVRTPRYVAPYDLLYLQLMQRKDSEAARAVLEIKWANTSEADAALQLAAHDDAFGKREQARQVLFALENTPAAGPLALARIGDFWMHRGEFAPARAAYDRGRDRFPFKATDYISRIAEWHLAQEHPDEAKKFVAAELATRPKDLILQAYLSAISLSGTRANQRADERRKLESILQQLPDSPFVRYHLGRAYLLEGTPKAASEQFERCVSLDPNYAPGWVALAELENARGNHAAAELRAEAVLRVYPNHMPANLARAKAQVGRGRAAEAEKTLSHLLEMQPRNTDALFLMGSAQLARNQAAKALTLFEQGAALAPGENRWVIAAAGLLARQGDPVAARAKLEDALKVHPADESLLFQLATLQIQQRDPRSAVRSFEKLRGLNANSVEYRLGHAGAIALTGDRQTASALYEEAEKLFPDHAPAWLQHAALLNEMKDPRGALAKYEQALARDKNNPMILNNLAWLMLHNGGPAEKALEYALQARRIAGRSPEIDDTLAAAYMRLSMYRNSTAIYEEMLTYLPESDRPRVRKLLESAKQKQSPKGDA
ncbi:MAG: tetratricopeptide repeat protein [Bryobacterales bacterium]|nr:tetratricopeptide repeat protein [Bryobacterales bacterium]